MNKKQIEAAAKAANKKKTSHKGNVKTNNLADLNAIVTNPVANAEDTSKETLTLEDGNTNLGETLTPEASNTNAEGTLKENSDEVITLDTPDANADKTLETPKVDPIEEALKLIADRLVTVFWHKRCAENKITKTTLYAKETLRKTDGSVTLPNPLFKDAATTPDEPETIIKPVYSLKRGKRIYYLHDVNELDIVKAAREKGRLDTLKKEEDAAKEALKK